MTSSNFTALVVIPATTDESEPDAWSAIQSLREQFDATKHYKKWPPHFTIASPFVPPESIKTAASILARAVAQVDDFEVVINEHGFFDHRDSLTAFLRDSTCTPLLDLHATAREALIQANLHAPPQDFVPHLTVVHRRAVDRPTVAAALQTLRNVRFKVRALVVLSRPMNAPDEPMSVQYVIPFRGGGDVRQVPPASRHGVPVGSPEYHRVDALSAVLRDYPPQDQSGSAAQLLAAGRGAGLTIDVAAAVAAAATSNDTQEDLPSPQVTYTLVFPTVGHGGTRLATAAELLSRIKWDSMFSLEDFTVGWYDRVTNEIDEVTADHWIGTERSDVTSEGFIPEHRVRQLKYRGKIVWDRATRLDLISGARLVPIARDGVALVEGVLPNEDPSEDTSTTTTTTANAKATHFIGLRVAGVASPELTEQFTHAQMALVEAHADAAETLVPLPLLHMTLALVRVTPGSAAERATVTAVREFARSLPESLNVELKGVDCFASGRCVYARVASGASMALLNDAHTRLRECLATHGVRIADAFEFVPHVSLARVPASVAGQIPRAAVDSIAAHRFGTLTTHAVDVTAVDAPHRSDGYYTCVETVPFGVQLPTSLELHDGRVLAIFDFDGTLVRTPTVDSTRWSPAVNAALGRRCIDGGLGYFETNVSLRVALQLLRAPHNGRTCEGVPVLVERLVEAYQRARRNPLARVVLLTGRTESCRADMEEFMREANLRFDEIVMRPNRFRGPTAVYKAQEVVRLVDTYHPMAVYGYDDDENCVPAMEKALEGRGLAHVAITKVVHKSARVSADMEYAMIEEVVRAHPRLSLSRTPQFTGILLDSASQAQLHKVFPAPQSNWKVRMHHITLHQGAPHAELTLGERVSVRVTRYGASASAAAVAVELPEHLQRFCASRKPHVTTAVSPHGASNVDVLSIPDDDWTPIVNERQQLTLRGHTQLFERFLVAGIDHAVGQGDDSASDDSASERHVDARGLETVRVAALTQGAGALELMEAVSWSASLNARTKRQCAEQTRLRESALDEIRCLAELVIPGTTLHLVGSYRLGVHSAESDLDCVAAVPATAPISTASFLRELVDVAAKSPSVMSLRSVPHARVPIASANIFGINVDVQVVRDDEPQSDGMRAVSEVEYLLASSALDQEARRLRDAWRLLLVIVKRWASARGVSPCRFGFPGGHGYAVLCRALVFARAHEGDSIALVDLVPAFFVRYAHMPWATRSVCGDGTTSPHDGAHPMVIAATPESLESDAVAGNVARSATASSVTVLEAELKRAADILNVGATSGVAEMVALLERVCRPSIREWQRTFRSFVSVTTCASNPALLETLVSAVESRLIGLQRSLERDHLCSLVRVYPHHYNEHQPPSQCPHAVRHAIGYSLAEGRTAAAVETAINDFLASVRATPEFLGVPYGERARVDAKVVVQECE